MIDEILLDKGIKNQISLEYKKLFEQLENDLLKETSDTFEARGMIQKNLDRLELAAAFMLDGNNNCQQILQEINQDIKNSTDSLEEKREQLKIMLKNKTSKILQTFAIEDNFFKDLLGEGQYSADLINQARSYFIRALYSHLFFKDDQDMGILNSRFHYITIMAGLQKELTEYRLIEEHIQKLSSQQKVYHSGSKNTELDIVISSLQDLEEIISKNTEISDEIFAYKNQDIALLQTDLLDKINWFGTQVKSKTLKPSGKTDQFSIGNRKILFEQFKQESNEYSVLQSMHFLARFQNILLTLGPANVFMSTNNKKQWMTSFITEFRRNNYLLSFQRKDKKEPLTQEVVLEQLYTAKTHQLRRFLQNKT